MLTVYKLVWEVTIFIIVFTSMFIALQKVDFSKIFKPNATVQIKIVIISISAAVAFGVAIGVGEIIELIGILAK